MDSGSVSRVNKILLPILNYHEYKKDLTRGHNSLVQSYELRGRTNTESNPKNHLNQNIPRLITESYSNNEKNYKYEPFFSNGIRLSEHFQGNKVQYSSKYVRVKNSVEDLMYRLRHENYKKGIQIEKQLAHDHIFQHPAMNIFMTNPELIQNQYIKRLKPVVNSIEDGEDPNQKDEIEVGQPIFYTQIVQVQRKKTEEVKKEVVIEPVIEEPEEKEEIPLYKDNPEEEEDPRFRRGRRKAKKLWRIARGWVNVSLYYFIHKDLSNQRDSKLSSIDNHKRSLRDHQDWLITWFKSVQKGFINDLLVDPDLNLSFNNYSGSLKLQEQSEKIISLINLLMRNLIIATSKASKIPKEVLTCLAYYCQNDIYLTKKLLSTFEVFRLDFSLNGMIRNHNEISISMLIVFFVISKTFIQRILMKIHDHFPGFKNFKFLSLSLKYLCSVIHYLIQDAFNDTPPKLKSILVYLNYLKSYKIKEPLILELYDSDIIKDTSIKYVDKDEFTSNLVPREVISDFFVINKDECSKIKKLFMQWGTQMGMLVRKRILNKHDGQSSG